MKNVNVTIPFDEEKLTALRLYAAQKNLSVESELLQALEALYTKNVPQNVRDFIGMKEQTKAAKSKPVRTSPPSADEGDGS